MNNYSVKSPPISWITLSILVNISGDNRAGIKNQKQISISGNKIYGKDFLSKDGSA